MLKVYKDTNDIILVSVTGMFSFTVKLCDDDDDDGESG